MANARMKKWLATKGKITDDWCWVKDCWRPVKSYRTVVRGKKKGWVEIELYYPAGKKKIVPKSCMKYKED